MKKISKTTCMILICGLLAAAFTSCSNKDVSLKENDPKIDKLTIMSNNRVLPDENDTKKWMEEELGVGLNFITVANATEYVTKVNLLIASDDIPDIVTDNSKYSEYYKHMKGGLYIEIEPLLEKYGQNILNARTKENLDSLRWSDGKLYVISSVVSPGYDGLLIRKDWLQKANLKVPETLDEFVNVARVFKNKDMNGNGKPDEIGFGGWNPSDPIIPFNPIFAAFGANPFGWIEKDGKIVHGGIQNEVLEAIKFLNSMYNEKLIDQEYLTVDRTKLNEKVGTEKIGMVVDQMWYVNKDNSIFHPTKNVDWSVIKPPVGPSGKSGIIVRSDPDATGRTGITKACKDPVTAIKYLNFIADIDNFNRIRAGVEGVHYTFNEGVYTVVEKYSKDNSLLLQEGIAPTYAAPFMPQDPPDLVVPDYMADYRTLLYSTHIRPNAFYAPVPKIDDNQVGTGWKDYYSQAINKMIIEGGDIDSQWKQLVDDLYKKYSMGEQEALALEYYRELNK